MSFYDNVENMFKLLTAGNPSLPLPSAFLTIPEATSRGRDLADEVFKRWDRLNDLVRIYEPTIQQRWEKRNFSQRESVLKAVNPKISKSHNIAIRLFYQKGLDRSGLRDNYLLPYCNIEDLCKEYTHLLGLIHHRARYPPQSFVSFDSKQIECGIYFQAIQRPFVNECALKLYGDRGEYGELVEFDQEDEDGDSGWDKMAREDALAPADALTLLEAQEKLLSFLVSVIEYLLQDLDTSLEYLRNASPPTTPLLCEGPVQTPKVIGATCTSLSKTNFLQPFSPPPRFMLSRLSEIASGRNEQLRDHLWLMRTEPNYFYQTVKEIDEHRIERLLGANGKPHEIFQQPLYYDRLAGAVVDDVYPSAGNWLLISQEVELVESIARDTKVMVGKPLEKKYEAALSHLELLLKKVLKSRIEKVKALTMSNPAFRKLFVRLPTDPARPTMIGASLKNNSSLDYLYRNDRLLWVLITMSDEIYTFAFSLSNLLDEFDYIMEKSPETEGVRISQPLYNAVGDVAALNEMLLMLKYHRPCFSVAANGVEHTLEEERWKLLKVGRAQGKLEDLKAGRHLMPYENFQTTTDSTKTPDEWSRSEKDAKKKLDTFWLEVNKRQPKSMKRMFKQLIREPAERGDNSSVPNSAVKEPPPATIKPVSTTVRPAETAFGPSGQPTTQTAKAKAKTRGIADSSYAEARGESSGSAPTAAATTPQKFKLTARATKFLTAALPSLSNLAETQVSMSQSGLFDWLDFLHSMSILGFSMEKKRGSIWMFVSSDGRSFVVHEPHPTRKLSFLAARFIGKRLERKFEWEKESFVLAD